MSSLIMSQTWILRSNISYLTYCIDEQILKYLFYVLYNNDTPSKATHRNQRGKYLLGTWTLPGENVFWTRMIPFWSLLHCTNCYLWPANCAPDTCSPVPPPPVHETLHRMPHILCQRRRRGGGEEGRRVSNFNDKVCTKSRLIFLQRTCTLTLTIAHCTLYCFYQVLSLESVPGTSVNGTSS